VHPIDLIGRVYRTHQLVYRCAKKTSNLASVNFLSLDNYILDKSIELDEVKVNRNIHF